MPSPGVKSGTPLKIGILSAATLLAAAACAPVPIQLDDGPYAPGVDRRAEGVASIDVAHNLMAAQQYELALDAFTRAALEQRTMSAEILSGMGTANLGLGRLGQAEELLRRAVDKSPDWPEAWNNLGVVLMERQKAAEAEFIFRKAYALDNGESDAIRDNLTRALEISENSDKRLDQEQQYQLVRQGSGYYQIQSDEI